MGDYPLFSMSVVSYKNFRYIYEALESIFMQDYPNIELIVSNDGSSDFEYEELLSFINKNKGDNITTFIINNNENNVGTVKHLNIVRNMSKGNYMMFMAADDALKDERVISRFVQYFEDSKDDCLLVTSQCGMYDIHLDELMHYAVSEENIKKLTTLRPISLFKQSIFSIIIPSGGTSYNRKVFEKIGGFDEEYFLIEDASFFLKALRLGIKVHYLDFISLKHRDGGISHGNQNRDDVAFSYYYLDEIRVFEKEVLPYREIIGEEIWAKANLKVRELKFGYFKRFKFKNASLSEKTEFLKDNSDVILNKLKTRLFVDLRRKIIALTHRPDYHMILIITALSFFFANRYADYSGLVGDTQNLMLIRLFGCISRVTFFIEIGFLLTFVTYIYYIAIKSNRYKRAYAVTLLAILTSSTLYWVLGLETIKKCFHIKEAMNIEYINIKNFTGITSLYLILFLSIFFICTQTRKLIRKVKGMF